MPCSQAHVCLTNSCIFHKLTRVSLTHAVCHKLMCVSQTHAGFTNLCSVHKLMQCSQTHTVPINSCELHQTHTVFTNSCVLHELMRASQTHADFTNSCSVHKRACSSQPLQCKSYMLLHSFTQNAAKLSNVKYLSINAPSDIITAHNTKLTSPRLISPTFFDM